MTGKTEWTGTADELAAYAEKIGLPPALSFGVLGHLVADLDFHLWRGEDGKVHLSIDEVTEI